MISLAPARGFWFTPRMKTLLFLAALAATLLPVHAQVSPIRLDVRQNVKAGGSGKPDEARAQARTLTITLQNNSKEAFAGLVVRYWFFARDVRNRNQSVILHGEKKGPLAPRAREHFETETATSTYTKKHSKVEQTNQGHNQQNNVNLKTVEASGSKITGYAVKVMDGEKVMAEYYSEPSMKAMLAGK